MRLDMFLSAARIFKSRTLANEALSSSMVFLDNHPAKPARSVRPGAIIEINTPRFYKKIEVLSLPPKNVRKNEASSLYRVILERAKN